MRTFDGKPLKAKGRRQALHCYYCMKQVTPQVHQDVQRSMLLLLGIPCDNDTHTSVAENSFVHMQGCVPQNLDSDDNVVVCPEDFVREIAENWRRPLEVVRAQDHEG